MQLLLHGEPGRQLQGQRLPLHAAGVRHGRGALHIPAGAPAFHRTQVNSQPAVELQRLFLRCILGVFGDVNLTLPAATDLLKQAEQNS